MKAPDGNMATSGLLTSCAKPGDFRNRRSIHWLAILLIVQPWSCKDPTADGPEPIDLQEDPAFQSDMRDAPVPDGADPVDSTTSPDTMDFDTQTDLEEPVDAPQDRAALDPATADPVPSDGLHEPETIVTACAFDPLATTIFQPVLMVHGVNGSADSFNVMIDRLVEDGWPRDCLFAYTFDDPAWGCNIDNAGTIYAWVDQILETTGHTKIDLVAHSMGTLSSRWYVKFLGGQDRVSTYVTLGGMHHGLLTPCLSPIRPCIWEELCSSGQFIEDLNRDPATPGNLYWVSIYGSEDDTVPNDSSHLDGAENIEIEGVGHDGPDGLLEHEDAYVEVRRVLSYPPR